MNILTNDVIFQEWGEKADENIHSGISLCKDRPCCPGCILIWLGIEQMIKLVIIGNGIRLGTYVIDDKEDVLDRIDGIAKSITKNKHGLPPLLKGLSGVVDLSAKEVDVLNNINAMFERRYLKYDYAVIRSDLIDSVKKTRVQLRAWLSNNGFRIDSCYEKSISTGNSG